jgi:hypothetical protein
LPVAAAAAAVAAVAAAATTACHQGQDDQLSDITDSEAETSLALLLQRGGDLRAGDLRRQREEARRMNAAMVQTVDMDAQAREMVEMERTMTGAGRF